MIYTNYNPLKDEVNKFMYNYAILADCRKIRIKNRNHRGKMHKIYLEDLPYFCI